MNQEQKERFLELVKALQGKTPQRVFADRLRIPSSTIANWKKKPIGAKSKLAVVQYVSELYGYREFADLDAYLDGAITLDDLLDPQYKLHETLTRFNVNTVRAWIKNRANLGDKIAILEDLVAQIGGIAKANSSLRLARSLQTLMDSGDPKFRDIPAIAELVGIEVKRLERLYRGEVLPCEDEVLALSPYLEEDIEELRRVYVTGEKTKEPTI